MLDCDYCGCVGETIHQPPSAFGGADLCEVAQHQIILHRWAKG